MSQQDIPCEQRKFTLMDLSQYGPIFGNRGQIENDVYQLREGRVTSSICRHPIFGRLENLFWTDSVISLK